MKIQSASFVKSSTKLSQCPNPDKPEFAFIGRSNVGKSSLINSIIGKKGLAKISSKPGKTQTMNHFEVNGNWYLVDLPGYGYASVSQAARNEWSAMMEGYFLNRENLNCVFILVDSRIEPQLSDLDFINWIGGNEIPLIIVMTKIDKLSRNELAKSVSRYKKKLQEIWEELPPIIQSSTINKTGRDEILNEIEKAIQLA
jgi:GTP-binding protein